jgi:hypothetical protein
MVERGEFVVVIVVMKIRHFLQFFFWGGQDIVARKGERLLPHGRRSHRP